MVEKQQKEEAETATMITIMQGIMERISSFLESFEMESKLQRKRENDVRILRILPKGSKEKRAVLNRVVENIYSGAYHRPIYKHEEASRASGASASRHDVNDNKRFKDIKGQ